MQIVESGFAFLVTFQRLDLQLRTIYIDLVGASTTGILYFITRGSSEAIRALRPLKRARIENPLLARVMIFFVILHNIISKLLKGKTLQVLHLLKFTPKMGAVTVVRTIADLLCN